MRVEKKVENANFSTFFAKIVYALAYVHIFLYLCTFLRRRRRKFLQPSRRIIDCYELDYFNYCRALWNGLCILPWQRQSRNGKQSSTLVRCLCNPLSIEYGASDQSYQNHPSWHCLPDMDRHWSRWHGVDRDIRIQRARDVLAFILYLHIDLIHNRTKVCVIMPWNRIN